MDELRTRRVAEAMREELSELIRFESSDPRLAEIEVTEVVLSPDARRADVLVRLPVGQDARAEAIDGLDRAKGYLRHQLAQRVELFRAPDLRFVPDSVLTGGQNLSRLRRRLKRGRPKD